MLERSRLFRLDPIDSDWGMRESLISYIVRLAAAHGTRTRELIRRVYLPLLDNPGGALHSPFYRNQARTINGVGRYASTFSELTELLTTQPGLTRHTLLPWRDLVPENGTGLIASHVRWCPACLMNQRRRGQPIHLPLLWSLDLYQVCHVHDRPMIEKCPQCSKHQQWIPDLPDQGRCTSCCGALYRVSPEPPTATDRQYRYAHLLANMLADDGDASTWATHANLSARLMQAADAWADGQKTTLSSMLGLTKTSLSCWVTKGQRPAFPQLVHVCDAFGVSMHTLLASEQALPKPRVADPPSLRIALRQNGDGDIEAELAAALADGSNRQSVAQIAKTLGVTRSMLKYRYPELVAALSAKYRESARCRAIETLQREVDQVRQLMAHLIEQGRLPTCRRLQPQLKAHQLSLRRYHLRAAFWKVRGSASANAGISNSPVL